MSRSFFWPAGVGLFGGSVVAVAVALVCAESAYAGGPSVAVAQADAQRTNQLIIKYRDGSVAASTAGSDDSSHLSRTRSDGQRLGVTLDARRTMHHGGHVMRMDRSMSVQQIRTLAAGLAATDANIESIEPDLVMSALAVPNDTYFPLQWHYWDAVSGINAPAAWDRTTGSGVRVAVVDTGYLPHPDLAANVLPGYDFVTNTTTANDGNARDANPTDPGDWAPAGACATGSATSNSSWHGTHVAGTIAAVTGNASGVSGVAYGAKVVPLRVLGRCGGYTSDIADAVAWAAGGTVAGLSANAYPVKVINMSLGGSSTTCGTAMQSAITTARGKGAVVVVAAGNSNVNASNATPANCSGVVVVGAVDRAGVKASFSNYGTLVDISAPGATGILSTLNAGTTTAGVYNYTYYQGTSMATPHVAGVAALMLAANPALTPDQVETRLKSSVRAFPVAFSGGGGAGMVDAKAAVDAALGVTPTVVAEVEANNTLAAPQTITATFAKISGTIASTTDTDYFKVTVPAGKTLAATMAPGVSSGTYIQNYSLYAYNSVGTTLASSVNVAGVPEAVSLANTSAAAQTYYVRVAYVSGGTGATYGKYTLHLLQK